MSGATPPTAVPTGAQRAADVVRAVNGVLLPGFTGTDDLVKLWRIAGGAVDATVLTSAWTGMPPPRWPSKSPARRPDSGN